MIDINSAADTVIVLDFETTGLSPDYGDCAIEIGAVKLVNGELVDRFQQLMNPHKRISAFIENYTGITNEMIPFNVMQKLSRTSKNAASGFLARESDNF